MDEQEFQRVADLELIRLERALEHLECEMDIEAKPGGIIELEFENGSKIIINRHGAAREIWVAARSGGFHFRHAGSGWISARDGETLNACLRRCISAQSGSPVAADALG